VQKVYYNYYSLSVGKFFSQGYDSPHTEAMKRGKEKVGKFRWVGGGPVGGGGGWGGGGQSGLGKKGGWGRVQIKTRLQ